MNTSKEVRIKNKVLDIEFKLKYYCCLGQKDVNDFFNVFLSYGFKNLWLQRKAEKDYEAKLDALAEVVSKYIRNRKSKNGSI